MSYVTLAATFDSTSLVTTSDGYPRLMFRCVRGLDDLWATRGRDSVLPGTAGRVSRSRKRDTLTILLEGWVFGVGTSNAEQLADFRAAKETLRTLFASDRDAATLSVVLEDGGTATITARPVNIAWGPDTVPIFQEASVELLAVGDDWDVTLAGS